MLVLITIIYFIFEKILFIHFKKEGKARRKKEGEMCLRNIDM